VAFTLVELLLVVVLLGLLFSAVIFSLDSLQRGAQLEEGAGQVETLLRFARARAAATGRQVRISFGPSDLTPSGTAASASASSEGSAPSKASGGSPGADSEFRLAVEWEPDPIGAPGHFEPLREAASYLEQIGALVLVEGRSPEIEAIPITGEAGSFEAAATHSNSTTTSPLSTAETNGPAGPRPPLFFYPDGSSDFAELVVRSRDEGERRSVRLTLSGLTGAIRQRWVSPESSGTSPASTGALTTAQAPTQSGGAR
jgi:type II secretory pathway pseudopilin PulG